MEKQAKERKRCVHKIVEKWNSHTWNDRHIPFSLSQHRWSVSLGSGSCTGSTHIVHNENMLHSAECRHRVGEIFFKNHLLSATSSPEKNQFRLVRLLIAVIHLMKSLDPFFFIWLYVLWKLRVESSASENHKHTLDGAANTDNGHIDRYRHCFICGNVQWKCGCGVGLLSCYYGHFQQNRHTIEFRANFEVRTNWFRRIHIHAHFPVVFLSDVSCFMTCLFMNQTDGENGRTKWRGAVALVHNGLSQSIKMPHNWNVCSHIQGHVGPLDGLKQ